MLGHDVPFLYCRKPGSDIPCRKIYDCWWQVFDIKSFMENNYSEETRKKVSSPPQEKMASLLDIIKEAQKNLRQDKTSNNNPRDEKE